MLKELAPKYDHKNVESNKMDLWKEKGYFAWTKTPSQKKFSILLPPPNITGKLHIGHAWDESLQDLLIRFKKLQGFDVRWQAGTDHAGISMQTKVEERMRNNGYDTKQLKRADFNVEAAKWKEEHQDIIFQQWEKLGLAIDSSKARYTMDDEHCKVVFDTFIKMYNQGLIYRGKRAVNWDHIQQTAISNMEVIAQDQEQDMYYIRYDIDGTNEFLEVATVRTETLYSDVAITVNPEDKRYAHLVGKFAIHPLTGEKLPIITDKYVSLEKGSGAMKCSAHATEDIAILEKNNLEIRESIGLDGNLLPLCGKFAGMDRLSARVAIGKELQALGKIIKIEKTLSKPGYSERSNALVEVMYMEQWFVDMKKVISTIEQKMGSVANAIRFVPERFRQTFENWINPETLQDWCISRQLMWGHQIPAWHKDGQIVASIESPGEGWKQDPDVLDTWFSSGLWPFSTIEKEWYVSDKHITSVLVTGYDIIFFWVARMIFQTELAANIEPFKDVLIHGLVRASDGRKMSKSLNNGVDPMEVIDQKGADALRWFLLTNSAPGQDLRYDDEKVTSSWNFINKIWNTARFTMMNLEGFDVSSKLEPTSEIDRWILGRLTDVKANVTKQFENYEFGIVGAELYRFVYDDFASNYIELAKVTLNDEATRKGTQSTLVYVLCEIAKLLHPFMPFVTEEIYTSIKGDSIMTTTFDEKTFSEEKEIDTLIDIIGAIRTFRVENNIGNKTPIKFDTTVNKELSKYTERLVNAFLTKELSNETVSLSAGKLLITIDMDGLVDKEAAKEQIKAEITKLESEIKRAEGMLANPGFVSRAPQAKIDEEKAKVENFKSQLADLIKKLEA